MTLADYFPNFLDNLGGRQSPRNRELYTLRLRLFLEMFGERAPGDVEAGDVQQWLSVFDGRNYAESTMAGYRQAVKTLFNWLVDEEVIDRSPVRKLRTPARVSSADLVADKLPNEADLLSARTVAQMWMVHSSLYREVRDGLMFRLCCACGLRRGELQRLKLSAVETALRRGINEFGFYEAKSRGKTGEVIVRFDTDVAVGFERYITIRPNARIDVAFIPAKRSRTKTDRELRWRMMSASSINQAFASLCAAAGVSAIHPHTIRHWLGTRVTRDFDAKTAARILNHRDKTGATALRYYAHVDDSDIGAAIGGVESAEIEAIKRLFGVVL